MSFIHGRVKFLRIGQYINSGLVQEWIMLRLVKSFAADYITPTDVTGGDHWN